MKKTLCALVMAALAGCTTGKTDATLLKGWIDTNEVRGARIAHQGEDRDYRGGIDIVYGKGEPKYYEHDETIPFIGFTRVAGWETENRLSIDPWVELEAFRIGCDYGSIAMGGGVQYSVDLFPSTTTVDVNGKRIISGVPGIGFDANMGLRLTTELELYKFPLQVTVKVNQIGETQYILGAGHRF